MFSRDPECYAEAAPHTFWPRGAPGGGGRDGLFTVAVYGARQKKARDRNLAEQDNLLYKEGPQGLLDDFVF